MKENIYEFEVFSMLKDKYRNNINNNFNNC